MAIWRLAIKTLAMLTVASSVGLTGCASQPVQTEKHDFNGGWSVQWCDKTDPDADCGGFDVDLTQVGNRISGESFGARARLAQIDEGGTIHGIAIGNTAVLTVESLRSGGIYLVEATVDGRCMHWKMEETIRERERDIDIIAIDDVLTKASNASSNNEAKREIDCRGIPLRAQD